MSGAIDKAMVEFGKKEGSFYPLLAEFLQANTLYKVYELIESNLMFHRFNVSGGDELQQNFMNMFGRIQFHIKTNHTLDGLSSNFSNFEFLVEIRPTSGVTKTPIQVVAVGVTFENMKQKMASFSEDVKVKISELVV